MTEELPSYAQALLARWKKTDSTQRSKSNSKQDPNFPPQKQRNVRNTTKNVSQRNVYYEDENYNENYSQQDMQQEQQIAGKGYENEKRHRKPLESLNSNVSYQNKPYREQISQQMKNSDDSFTSQKSNTSNSKYNDFEDIRPAHPVSSSSNPNDFIIDNDDDLLNFQPTINQPSNMLLQPTQPMPQLISPQISQQIPMNDFVSTKEYDILKERNFSLEKQIQKLQENQKASLSDDLEYKAAMKNQNNQLELAYKRISELENLLKSKDQMIQNLNDGLASMREEMAEYAEKYKKQVNDYLQMKCSNKELELEIKELRKGQENYYYQQPDSYQGKTQQKYNQDSRNMPNDYIDYPSSISKPKQLDDNLSYRRQPGRQSHDDDIDDLDAGYTNNNQRASMMRRPVNDFSDQQYHNKNDEFNNYDDNTVSPLIRAKADNANTRNAAYNKPNSQDNSRNAVPRISGAIHPAMKDNLIFGDDVAEKKDNFDQIVRSMRDDEIQNQYKDFIQEREEKEKKLSKAPEQGVNLNRARIMKEQLEDEVEDLTRKISLIKREMKQRGLYC